VVKDWRRVRTGGGRAFKGGWVGVREEVGEDAVLWGCWLCMKGPSPCSDV